MTFIVDQVAQIVGFSLTCDFENGMLYHLNLILVVLTIVVVVMVRMVWMVLELLLELDEV